MRKLIFCLFFSAFFSTQNFAATKYDSVSDMIADQKIIRVLLDYAPGYGNQAATVNMMNRLWQLQFHGTFELIYPDEMQSKVIDLFNLPNEISDIYSYQDQKNHKVIFIRETVYIKMLIAHQIEPVSLGITGAHDSNEEDGACVDECAPYANNFATFTNSDVFVALQPWFMAPTLDAYHIKGEGEQRHAVKPPGKYWVYPVSSLEDAKKYLETDPNGQILLKKKPALSALISGIEKQDFNFLSVYGYTFQKKYNDEDALYGRMVYPDNIIQVITSARYAQLTGPADMKKPLIIAVYYDYVKEEKGVLQYMQTDNWGKYENKGAENMRVAIKTLGLRQPNVFSIASIDDVDAAKKITSLQSGQILLLSMGVLPKVVFDGMYTHVGNNIWPQFREGEGALSSLLLEGKPHFRCVTEYADEDRNKWEPGFESITDIALKNKLVFFYGKNGFCANGAWEKNNLIYQIVGEALIDAHASNSAISRYFADIQAATQQPRYDRILRGLEKARKVIGGVSA